MCGIIGYTGPRKALPLVIQGLRLLEYRGYDSAGVALCGDGSIRVIKREGKLANLEAALPATSAAKCGIGHTRWATHGAVSDANAHPHLGPAGKVAIVHNGIIDNWAELKRGLEAGGAAFASETDSEILAHLVERELARPERAGSKSPEADAVAAALNQVSGTYGLACVFADRPGLIVGARNGSPLAIGVGEGECFLASDPAAFASHTRQAVFLRDGELAVIEARRWETRNLRGETLVRSAETIPEAEGIAEKGAHPDFFLKEVYEQPQAVERTLGGRIVRELGGAKLGGLEMSPRELHGLSEVVFVGMGTALHAAMSGKALVEAWARVPARAEDASEFRATNPIVEADALYVAVSQSGETADTLAAVREIQAKGGRVIGLVNSVGSSLARLCGAGVYLHAGQELSVAASKSYLAQVTGCALIALAIGRARNLSLSEGRRIVDELLALPPKVEAALALRPQVEELASRIASAQSALFLGRGFLYPAALEGALKLKELSYLHAEGFAGGALKHGPLALVGPETPTFALLAPGDSYERTLSNMAEVRARRGRVVAVCPGAPESLRGECDELLALPPCIEELAPILALVPLQLLARSVASRLGRDVDRPRNLAKSVTTE
jgi:glucosamine--fructose-6-phosphate aminotransferase (isomerizing)